MYVVKQQHLQEFYDYNWQANRMTLTDDERACFTRVEFMNTHRRLDVKYVFTEPWRYVLKIAPYIITHKKPLDLDIERELAYINDYIDSNYIEPRLHLLTRGTGYSWHDWYHEPTKYINKLKNIHRYSPKEAYLELET